MNNTSYYNSHAVAVLTYLVLVLSFSILSTIITQYDLIQYLAGANLFANSDNPYDTTKLFVTEHIALSSFYNLDKVVVLYTPPVTFPIVYFLKFFDYSTAKIIWIILTITALFWGSWYFVATARHAKQHPHFYSILLLLSITFSPFYAIIWYGQISWLLFLGWIGFLICYQNKPILAGLFLSLTLIKPHLLFLVYLLLILNVFQLRPRKSLLGLLLGFSLLSITALLINPKIYSYYFEFAKNPPIDWQTLNLGSWLQYFTGQHTSFMRFLPTVIVIFVTLLFFARKQLIFKNSWQLSNQVLVHIVGISILTSPYGWQYDCVLLYPTMISLLLNADRSRNFRLLQLLILVLLFSVLIQAVTPVSIGQHYLTWYVVMFIFLSLLGFSKSSKNA